MALSAERRHGRGINASNRQRTATVERCHCRQHETPGGRKENCRVERRRRTFLRAADPLRAKIFGKFLMDSAAAHHENPASPILEHLDREIGRAAEAIEADGRAAPDLCAFDRAKTNYPG